MSEAGFQVFNKAFSIGTELLYAVYLTLFLRPFMIKKRQRAAAFVLFLYLFCSRICDWLVVPQGTFSLLLIILLAAGARMAGVERTKAFLLGILFWNARICSALTVESLYFVGNQVLPYREEPPKAVYLRSAILLLMLLLSHAVLFAVMLYVFCKQMRKQRQLLSSLEMCYISLIPAAGILFGQLISGLLYEIKDGEMLELYGRHPSFLVIIPLLALMFYAGTYLTIMSQQRMAELREEQAASFMESRQVQMLRARICEAEQFYERIRQMNHEMRGHMTNIKGLARSKEYAKLNDYISRMNENMGEFELVLQTGNPVTDVIVNGIRRQCLDKGIRFQTEFYYPETGSYDAFDMGIILQNLLQNALEACEKAPDDDRFILLAGRKKGRFFLMEVRNSFTGKAAFGRDGLPVTDKKSDISMHGIGLSNVRRTVEKYMGELEISMEEQVFRVTVMVQERSQI